MTEHGDEMVYTLAGAAAAAGVSMPTIRRREDELLAAGAVKTTKRWEIPHSALVAAGFNPTWTVEGASGDGEPQEPHQEPSAVEPTPSPAEELRALQDRVRRLESENTILRSHVDKWQSLASERLDALNDQRVAFRALIMAQPQKELEPRKPEPEQPAPEPKRGWWARAFS